MMEVSKNDDQVTEILGDFGRWQALLLAIFCVFHFFTSFQVLVTSFMAIEPDFFCTPIVLDNSSDSPTDFESWTKLGFDHMNKSLPRCKAVTFDRSDGFQILDQSCNHWTYDHSFYAETLVTKFDLVCENDFLLTLHQMVYMMGVLFGALVSGLGSDRFGRRTVLMWTCLGVAGFGSMAAFSTSMPMFIVARFLTAVSVTANFIVAFVYSMEQVGGSYRTVVGIGLEYPWALSYSILATIAYYLPTWWHLQLLLALPMILAFPVAMALPESPRWLLARNRVEEATVVLKRALEINNKEWPKDLILHSTAPSADEDMVRRESIVAALRTPNMRRKALVQFYLWFTAAFVYYGLTLNAGKLIPGDLYVNFTVSGLIEFPAYTITLIMLVYMGRRLPLALTYLGAGVFLLITIVSPPGVGVLAVSSAGKFGVICAFAIIYVYTAELYPTIIRNSGLGSSSMCARIGSILAPVAARELPKMLVKMDFSEEFARWSPIVVFAITSIVAAFLTLLLPETQGTRLPDAIHEAEEFGKGAKFKLFDLSKTKDLRAKNDNEGVVNVAFDH